MEFLERTGLDKKLESARVAGLQAAKDKEIAALKTIIENKDSDIMRLGEEILLLKTQTTDLNADLDAKTRAFDEAQATIEQLKSAVKSANDALAETQAALDAEINHYREQVGLAMQPNTSENMATAAENWTTAMKARNASRRSN